MPEEEAVYHMKRCVDSGLWLPEANKGKEESGDTTEKPIKMKQEIIEEPIKTKQEITEDSIKIKQEISEEPIKIKQEIKEEPIEIKQERETVADLED